MTGSSEARAVHITTPTRCRIVTVHCKGELFEFRMVSTVGSCQGTRAVSWQSGNSIAAAPIGINGLFRKVIVACPHEPILEIKIPLDENGRLSHTSALRTVGNGKTEQCSST